MEALWLSLGDLLPFIAIGFAAQIIDGALGMAFGAVANSLLVGYIGIPPARASYKVHVIRCFTKGVSGISNALVGNIDQRLFMRIAIPGMIGGGVGAYGLAQIDGKAIKPLIFRHLTLLGVVLVGTVLSATTAYWLLVEWSTV